VIYHNEVFIPTINTFIVDFMAFISLFTNYIEFEICMYFDLVFKIMCPASSLLCNYNW